MPKHVTHHAVKEIIMRSLLLSAVFALSVLSLSVAQLSAAPADSAPATVRVTLPADATLTIDGHTTRSTSADRLFVSPPLEPGRTFYYTFEARFVRAGKTISVQQKVAVRAGRETVVSLEVSEETGGPAGGWYGYSYSAAPAETRSYYEPPLPPAPRASEAPAREPRPVFWGTDPSDPFYHGSSW
jgi:uncharacterized protein (TIGR03000 family)